MKLKSLIVESKISEFKSLLSKYDGWAVMSDDASKEKQAEKHEIEMGKIFVTMSDSEKKEAMNLFNSKSTSYKKFDFEMFNRFMEKRSRK